MLQFTMLNQLQGDTVTEELELAWVREALQTRLRVELMSNAMHKELVLKGGMAMRAVHGSVRYTKDIDLDADERASKERIQGVVRRSIERAVSSGLIANATVTTPKQTDTTLRWKITGTQPNSSAPMHLTVEVSRRPKLIEGHVVEVALDKAFNRTGRDVKVQVLDSQHIAVTKVLFDLNVLLEAGVKDPGPLLAQLSDAQLRLPLLMAELWPKIEAMSYEQFRNDVVPYLPTTVGLAIDSEAFDTMRVDVGVAVERWLQSATSLRAAS
jgi:hypothetical protein